MFQPSLGGKFRMIRISYDHNLAAHRSERKLGDLAGLGHHDIGGNDIRHARVAAVAVPAVILGRSYPRRLN